MMYAVLFTDDDSRVDMRPKHMPGHLKFLERKSKNIHAAGPLKDTESDAPAEGLWLVEAETPQFVQSPIDADPF